MDDKRRMLLHFLAALAYRTQKAVRDAPHDCETFEPPSQVRPPKELVRHMTSVLGYARTFFIGGRYRAEPLESLAAEVERFDAMIADLAHHIEVGADLRENISPERLLQGPFSDAMTHAGQLALLRRLAGSPVRPENFIFADINANRLGPDQPAPVSPDELWPETPAGLTSSPKP
jgi:hypothetical protein